MRSHTSFLTRVAHGGSCWSTAVDIKPQWLRSSWWRRLECNTWGSREGSRRSLSLWRCQRRAKRGTGLRSLPSCQSCQSPSANLKYTTAMLLSYKRVLQTVHYEINNVKNIFYSYFLWKLQDSQIMTKTKK